MDVFRNKEPTFYEMLMQDRLQGIVFSSMKFVLTALFDRFPQLTWLRYYVEYVSSGLMAGLDIAALIRSNGNFAENFYSLKRVPEVSSMFLGKYLLVNYLAPLALGRIASGRLKILKTLYNLAKGLHMIGYLYMKFPYFSPEYSVINHKVVRQDGLSSISYVLLAVLLLLKGLEIFVISRSQRKEITEVKVIPPPYTNSKVPKGTCGICKAHIANPAVLVVSGYVFCYLCIKKHLEVFSMCPITNTPAVSRHIRILHV